MDERAQFAFNVRSAGMSIAEACRVAGVSRKTGHKWLKRFDEGGVEELADRSTAPLRRPGKTESSVEEYVVELRRQYPTWGARKLRAILFRKHPGREWPASSTIHDILHRHGLVEARPKRRAKDRAPTAPLAHATAANEVWSVDYKGQFRLGDGSYCYPLTVTDNYSRMLLGCFALAGTHTASAQQCMSQVFELWGLPVRIRSDNGTPFSSRGVRGLSRLSAWWYQLGVEPERIEPGKPQQNGRHERMHLTLKKETARPAAKDPTSQQTRFDQFVDVFNHVRPHEALGQTTPASHYEPSAKIMPNEAAPIDYPECDIVKRVSKNGTVKLRSGPLFIGESLTAQNVGLLELEDGVWMVRFANLDLGLFEVGDTSLSPLERGKISKRHGV